MRRILTVALSFAGEWSEFPLTDDRGVEHGHYKVEECIWAIVRRCEDGFISCALLSSGTWTCEDCMRILEEMERNER